MEETKKFIKNYLDTVNSAMKVNPTVDYVEEEDGLLVDIKGDRLSFLIGFRGTSLDGLQHLISLAIFKEFGEWRPVTIDINNYRDKRKEKLEEIAKSSIDKVRFFNEEVELSPMSPFDRKQIHEFISGYDDVTSSSVGEGSERRIVIKPAL